ncbi:MAG: GIY-YIG nuclease family protein [Ruminococcus sp.]|nr:GIY-YIG nuclease family protein [Ruminococcus sp.]
MLEVLYRIYEVADEETAKKNAELDREFGLYSSTSKSQNIELLTDCLICDSRDHFKEIIRSEYGEKISFRYSKKLEAGDLYCIIIGEHCYNLERYFNKVTFTCDCCGAKIENYYGKPICFDDYEIKYKFYNIKKYSEKRFCSHKCKQVYEKNEQEYLKPDDEQEFFIKKDMFTEDTSGYIYKITKKSTGEFYIGQTVYAPVFRWGQHLKTDRFPIKDILDYQFEVIEIVPKNENILEREKHYIQKYYKEAPDKSLNVACTANVE